MQISPITDALRPWVNRVLTERWGSPRIVSRGHLHDALALPGFVARIGDTPLGLLTYRMETDACEIVSLDSLSEGMGIGSALISEVLSLAQKAGCLRVWLITTNDNMQALAFFQRRGFTLKAIYTDAVAKSRRLKPEIPLTGIGGIPLRDEIELEFSLTS